MASFALFRPCRRIVQVFVKLPILHQTQYTGRLACVERIQGYVAVTQNLGCSSAIIKQTNNVNDNAMSANEFASFLQNNIIILCQKMINGEIRNEDFLRIIKSYVIKDNNQSEGAVGLTLLSYCGHKVGLIDPVDRRILTNSIWDLLVERSPNLTLQYYHTLLNVYAQNSQAVDPKTFLQGMKVKPDFTTHRLLLNVAAKNGDIDSVLYILSLMEDIGHPLDVTVYNSMIEAYTHHGEIKSVLATFEKIKELGLECNVETYAQIAKGYAHIGDIDNVMSILNDYEMDLEQILDIAKNLCISGYGRYVPEVVKYLPSKMKEIDLVIFSLINDLIIAGKYNDARIIVNHVVTKDSRVDNTSLIRFYLQRLVRYEAPITTIVEIIRCYVTSRKYLWALQDICIAALIFHQRELALEALEIMHELSMDIRPHYYWPLLIQVSRDAGEADIFKTIKHMLSLNVKPDYDTLYLYVLPFVNTHDPLVTIRKFNDHGIGIGSLLTPLICHLLDRGNIREAISLCSKTTGTIDFSRVLVPLSKAFEINCNVNNCVKMFQYAPKDKPYPQEFLTILSSGKRKKLSQRSIGELSRAFEAHGITVSDFHRMDVDKLDESMDEGKRMQTIPHPWDMSLDELACHLIELRSKGMNTRGVLRKLLMLYCRESDVSKVDETAKEYMDSGFLWTPGMYSTLMMFYTQNHRSKEALSMYKELRKYYSDFKIDDFKLLQLSTTLIKDNQFDEAMFVLKSACIGRAGGRILSRECWQLLNAVAHSSRSEMTERVLDLLVNAGYCKRTNVTLGPLVRKHLLNNDLVKAVDEFMTCVAEYNCTPLRQELFDTLLRVARSEDPMKTKALELLDTIEAAILRVYGSSAVVQMNKFVALIKIGTKEETDLFFKEHQVPHEVFKKGISSIVGLNRLKYLSKILNCEYLPMEKKILIYELILAEHSINGDCEKAIELYRQMCTAVRVPPRTFTTSFVRLLEYHRVPVPNDLMQRR